MPLLWGPRGWGGAFACIESLNEHNQRITTLTTIKTSENSFNEAQNRQVCLCLQLKKRIVKLKNLRPHPNSFEYNSVEAS